MGESTSLVLRITLGTSLQNTHVWFIYSVQITVQWDSHKGYASWVMDDLKLQLPDSHTPEHHNMKVTSLNQAWSLGCPGQNVH